MPDSPIDILKSAQTLIRNGAFTEARNLLNSIAHHPTAQDWLSKLERIAPPPTADNLAETALPFDELPSATQPIPFDEMPPVEVGGFSAQAADIGENPQWEHCRVEFDGEKIDLVCYPERDDYTDFIKQLVRRRTVTGALRSRAIAKVYPELIEKLGEDGWQAIDYDEREDRIVWVFKRHMR